MRVLAVVPNYPPASRVGAWLATHQFLRHMASVGHDVTVFVSRSRQRAWELDGVRVETAIRGRSHALELARGADVVVSHAGDGGHGLEVARAAGKPAVRMVHGHGYANIGDADLAVFNSHSLRRSARHDGPAIVCHPPVFAADHDVDRTGAEAVTIVNCSRDKGIKTAWRLAELEPDRLFLGVRGGYGEQVTPRARNFSTLPSQPDMRRVWRVTRVLLMPSCFETWGMVGVEAMCAGIPVIAHPTPGLLESLGDAGWFVDRDDIRGWRRILARLDDPDEYAAASSAARARAAELDPAADLARFAEAVLHVAEARACA